MKRSKSIRRKVVRHSFLRLERLEERQAPSVTPLSFEVFRGTQVQIDYKIDAPVTAPVAINIYRSAGTTAAPGDTLLKSIVVSDPSYLTVGTHTQRFNLGSGADQVPLPGAGAPEASGDYSVLAVADGGSAALRGVYHLPGGGVFIQGSAAADSVVVRYGTTTTVNFNGTVYAAYARSDVTTINARLHGGNDTFDFAAGAASGTAVLPVLAYAGSGSDSLRLGDSPGNDTLTLRPASATMTGPGYSLSASGFGRAEAYGGSGGTDLARYYDSAGDDKFESRPTWAALQGPGYFNYAGRFSRYEAYATAGGNDLAQFFDSPGDDKYQSRATWASMTGPSYFAYAGGFNRYEGFATAGGNDLAQLYDTPGNDTYEAHPTWASLSTTGYLSYAKGFDRTEAYGGAGGTDLARFYGGAGDDKFESRPTWAALQGPGYFNYAGLFSRYEAYAGAGGNDLAQFFDSPGDDKYESRATWASMTGPSYFAYAGRFDRYEGFSTAGGYDLAQLFDTPGDDRVYLTPDHASLESANYLSFVRGFHRVETFASTAPHEDMVDITDGPAGDAFSGGSDWFKAANAVDLLFAKGFDRVVLHQTAAGSTLSMPASPSYRLEVDGWSYRTKYYGIDFNDPRIVALRQYELPAIYAAYGLTASSSELARADAIRDWVARMAVHPATNAHDSASTSNLAVLPVGKTWADVNALETEPRLSNDAAYWTSFHYDGYAMLDALLGKLNSSTGAHDNSGMMQKIGPAQYRIKDLATYKFVQCTWQDRMLQVLWAAAGLNSMMMSINGHDPLAVYIKDLHQWVWDDVTFNERLLINGRPATPRQLLDASLAGGAAYTSIRRVKQIGPSWDPTYYAATTPYTYFRPDIAPLMTYMRADLKNDILGGIYVLNTVNVSGSRNDPSGYLYPTVADTVAFPNLG